MLLRYLPVWFLLAIVAIANGFMREALFKDALGELHAHQLSTLTLIVFFGIMVWLIARVWPLRSARAAWLVGSAWLVMTIAFEFLFGHFVAGHTWERLFADYNIFAGRLWLFVLLWTTIAPYIFFKIATLRRENFVSSPPGVTTR